MLLSGALVCRPDGNVKVPAVDWKQQAKGRPMWMQGEASAAFKRFEVQKWRDSFNIAAADPIRGLDRKHKPRVQEAFRGRDSEDHRSKGALSKGVTDSRRMPGNVCFAEVLGRPSHTPSEKRDRPDHPG